jgi:acetylserotonin N-methyltransferase
MTDPSPVLDLIEAFRRSKTMFAALSLGVFDRLSGGPRDAATLAMELGAHADSFERLLDACVSLGLLESDGATYSNSAVARDYLVRSSPSTLAGYIQYSNDILFPMWACLEDAVREGSHRWKQAHGLEGPLFASFFRTEAAKRDFLLGMHGLGQLGSPAVVAAFDLSRFRRLVDLGGATGHLALAALERYPAMEAAVLDLAPAIEFAREFVAGTRVELIVGDFFADPLPSADLYALGRILHDWNVDKIRALLGRVHGALPPGGGILIAEKLLRDDRSGPIHAHMQSMNMLVCTEGRERSFAEYADLLEEAGFTEMEGRITGAPVDAVMALKS